VPAKTILATVLLLLGLALPLSAAQSPPVAFDWEIARLEGTPTENDYLLVLWLEPAPGWYAYSHDPGPTGQPTVAQVTLLPSQERVQVLYPIGRDIADMFEPGATVSAYLDRTPLFVPLPNYAPNQLHAEARIQLLLCSKTSCFPVRETIVIEHDLADSPPPPAQSRPWWNHYLTLVDGTSQDIRSVTDPVDESIPEFNPRFFLQGLEVKGLAKAMLLAFLAGLLLNVMPCVLPVLALKVRAMLPQGEQDQARENRFRLHNIFYSLGVLTFFSVLAALAAFAGMAWGELFQSPAALTVMTAIVFAFGLSLLDVFRLPFVPVGPKGPVLSRSISIDGYLTGILATLLATPCSGPFLGGVLAWSLFQPPLVIAVVFLSIGLGMASPFMLAALFPQAARLIPSPGDWMVRLEQVFGLVLMITTVYLLSLLPADRVLRTLLLLWFLAAGAMLWGKWTTLSQSTLKRRSIRGVALVLLVLGLLIGLRAPEVDVQWREFEQAEFVRMLGQERMVVQFTADWCPNCKFLERTVLREKNLSRWKERYGFVAVRVDLTRENLPGTRLLRELGSQSIPLVALFPAEGEGSEPLVLRDLFTTSQFEEALSRAFPQ
jgi:thiol:disulfide interchange protein